MSTRVLYIAGAGRSGSTLLELILGNAPGFCSVGEIRYFWEYWHSGTRLCGCKELLTRCPFWARVHDSLGDLEVPLSDLADLASRLDRTRNLPRIARSPHHAFPQELVTATRHLYRAVDVASAGSVIVDSSKVPTHLYLLAQAQSIDLRILHLVRDSRAVAYSWSRRVKSETAKTDVASTMPRKSLATATVAWAIENLATTRAAKQLGVPYSLVRYEDFVQQPDATLRRSFGDLGLAEPGLPGLSCGPFPICPTHSVGGNPLRFQQDQIEIRPDNTWRLRMPRWQQICLGLATYPLIAHWRYRL